MVLSLRSLVIVLVCARFAAVAGAPAGQSGAARSGVEGSFAARFVEVVEARPEAGREIHVRLVEARAAAEGALPERGEAVSWEARPAKWFFVRTGGTQDNFDEAPRGAAGGGDAGEAHVARVVVPLAGIAVIGADLREEVVSVDAAELAAFCEAHTTVAEGAQGALKAAVGVQRVQRIESATTLVRIGERGREQARSAAVGKTAQAVEIRPLMDPLTMRVGGDIAVRVYVGGGGHRGARVFASSLGSGRVQEFTADRSGIGHFAMHEGGAWRIETHHLARGNVDDGEAPWVLYTATLTFRAGDDAGGEGGGR